MDLLQCNIHEFDRNLPFITATIWSLDPSSKDAIITSHFVFSFPPIGFCILVFLHCILAFVY